jgi:MerR family transcriptional regulator, copper efflux regulator
MRIAEVSERSGFSPATLRYYEELDLVPRPPRTPSGYRAYDDSVLDRLIFIRRAKRMGCSLEEVARLMPAWDDGRCAPVQAGLRQIAAAKLEETRARAAELAALTADLERIVAGLGSHTPDGPCDAECGCVSEPVTCTLDATELPGRLDDWRDVMGHVTARTPLAGGIRFDLDAATPLGRVAELIRAEHACCSFFDFALTVDGRGSALEVRGPAEGLALFD